MIFIGYSGSKREACGVWSLLDEPPQAEACVTNSPPNSSALRVKEEFLISLGARQVAGTDAFNA